MQEFGNDLTLLYKKDNEIVVDDRALKTKLFGKG